MFSSCICVVCVANVMHFLNVPDAVKVYCSAFCLLSGLSALKLVSEVNACFAQRVQGTFCF